MKNFYRTEIDGLRALGILGVILYHLEIFFNGKQFFPGGFLGVDIFFVVSGYLITNLLYEEYKLKGTFSLTNFYFRRAKRLLPALVTVVFFTTLLSYFFLFPSEYDYYLKSVTASLFFISNIFFHYSGQNYGENIISEKPLLHTWSLGVEEQFYIFFPLFLLCILKFFRKFKLIIILLFIFLSLFFCLKISSTHPSFNFYFLSSRIWELLIGGIIVFISKDFKKFDSKIKSNSISLIGIFLIIFSFINFDDVNNHPSTFTILPVTGCFLILLNNNKDDLIKKFLSFSVLRGIGLISYSLYLWHYPIFVFGKITNFTGADNQNLNAKLILILIAILLSILTFLIIENTFRKKINFKINHFFLGISVIYLLCIFGFYNIKTQQEKQFPIITKELKKRTWFETKQYFKPCFQRKKYFCSFNKRSEKSIFLIGDSVMASLQNELKNILITKNYKFTPMTNAGCDFIKISNKKNESIFCNLNIHNERIKSIKKDKKSILIIHLNYSNEIFEKDEISQQNFINDIYKLLNSGHKVILIYPIPQMKIHTSNVLSEKLSKNKNNSIDFLNDETNFIHVKYNEFKEKSEFIINILDKINHINSFKLNIEDVFCNTKVKDKCIGHDNENLYFIDNSHLSNFSAKIISKKLYEIISRID